MTAPNCHIAWVDTPVGRLTLMYEETPLMLTCILLPGEATAPSGKGPFASNAIAPAPDAMTGLIMDFLTGKRFQPPWDIMRLDGITPLQQAVYRETAAIPYGHVATYKDIASRIGRPNACRFVGSALARNPFPILVPCHRVIRSDNQLGGFGGGLALKELLIDFEAGRSRMA